MKAITLRFWVSDEGSEPPVGDYGRITEATLHRWMLDTFKKKDRPTFTLLSDKELADIAEGNAQREYYATVRGFITDLLEQVRAGDIEDEDSAREYVEQSVDGCHDVIYTHAAMEVCRVSKNDGAYFEEMGSEGAVEDGAIQWSKLAYFALLADIWEDLDLSELFQCEECNGAVDADDWKAAGPEATRATCASCREAIAAADEQEGGAE